MIRESTGKSDAAEKLMAAFTLDEEQTTAILDSQLYKIAQMEIKKILDELKEKTKEAKKLEELLGSESQLWAQSRGTQGDGGEIRRPPSYPHGFG